MQSLDHRFVGIAEIALVVDDALAFEAWRIFGEVAIGIDGEGDRRVDAARFELGTILLPDLEVLTRRDLEPCARSQCRCPQ